MAAYHHSFGAGGSGVQPLPLRPNPVILQINAWVWVEELSKMFGRNITLGSVPPEVLDELAAWSPDVIWLMGVWQRSPLARKLALQHPEDYKVLSDLKDEDVVGSPYAVYRYTIEPRLGGKEELAMLRSQLRQRKIGLFLDYVPNHVALDHHWTLDSPECLVQGTPQQMAAKPTHYFRVKENNRIYAHGKDPYFPPWADTCQVNAFSRVFRDRALEIVQGIAEMCDGIRCDMAMLLVNRVFADVWPDTLPAEGPPEEFWAELIPQVKKRHPGFVFMAEVYWEMEWDMQQLGFDFTYDKRLYDRLRTSPAKDIRDHLLASAEFQRKLVRFVENHDEPRALHEFKTLERSRAAATLALTLPGARLVQEGQFEGRTVKLPVQLGRRPAERANIDLMRMYSRLMDEVGRDVFHVGVFGALGVHPILGDDRSHESVFAYMWHLDDGTVGGGEWRIVVINYSEHIAKARIMLPLPMLSGNSWIFKELLMGHNPPKNLYGNVEISKISLHNGDDILYTGLPLELPPWATYIYTPVRA